MFTEKKNSPDVGNSNADLGKLPLRLLLSWKYALSLIWKEQTE